jgi:hypothetical protein
LKANGKSKSTAYRWIRKYCQTEQKELPFQTKEPTSKAPAIPTLDEEDSETAASFQMTRGAEVRTLDEAKQTLSSFLNKFEKEDRSKYVAELIAWLMEVAQ